eukprot:jgi/Galph1/4530/GphlegSOOS_G3189.1
MEKQAGSFHGTCFQHFLPKVRSTLRENRCYCNGSKRNRGWQLLSNPLRASRQYGVLSLVGSAIRGPPGMGGSATGSTEPVVHGGGNGDRRPGSHKGFVEEMRFVAMRLHTRDQAKEGTLEESALPIQEASAKHTFDWRPTVEDYLQFLVDSKYVYDFFETFMEETYDQMFVNFKRTGLERVPALNNDLKWFQEKGYTVPEPGQPGTRYVEYLKSLVKEKPHALLCHWYNFYFAHTAGGRMIGRLMSNLLFEGRVFEFYKWERDVKQILDQVRLKIDETAKDWPREVKDDCLNETNLSFSYSGMILSHLAKRG